MLPYPPASFDMIFARLSLQSLPFLPGTGLGVEAALQEIRRVLRPKGMVEIVVPFGEGFDFVVPEQRYTESLLRQVVSAFKIAGSIELLEMGPEIYGAASAQGAIQGFGRLQFLKVLLQA
jgi:ubiquinone/menaquinone biosynthesis C-methylase UbiE